MHFRPAAEPSRGFFNPYSGEVLINDDLADHALAVTIAHEVGHAFGLVHVTDRPSVMAPGNLDVEPNAEDANALAALWGPCVLKGGEDSVDLLIGTMTAPGGNSSQGACRRARAG